MIKNISAKEILDSRGNPTVKVELVTDLGKFSASVPSGASKGKEEAMELRDGGKRFKGMGVLKAVRNVNIIGLKLKGKEVVKQKEIDNLLIRLDGTRNKSRLGANAILGVSLAVSRAGAKEKNIPLWKNISQLAGRKPSLPTPCFNVINGGAHAKNDLDFQEFMIVPMVKPFSKAFNLGLRTYQELKRIIKEKYGVSALKTGDEGGFAPPVKRPEQALDLILEAVRNLNFEKEIKIILDVASSQFFKNGRYETNFKNFSSDELIEYYSGLIKKYPIIGLEDPLAEDDWKGWKRLKSRINGILLIGDDLTVTNKNRVKRAIKEDCANAIIIKPNQRGTLKETVDCAKTAQRAGWKIVVSNRSGETMDDFISDLAVGIGAEYIKSGAPFPKERMAKYKRLLKIEKEI